MLLGNVLHVTKLAKDRRTASGHLAPPCRSMTKLYNFNAIESWDGYTPERLHGGNVRFRAGFTRGDRRMLHEEVGWEEADFRCLHLCFLKRSSRDTESTNRRNIIETFGPTRLHTLWYSVAGMLGFRKAARWKRSRYMRGPEAQVPVEAFFPGQDMNWFFRKRRPVATVAFNMIPRRGPYGGGNQWLNQLSSYLKRCGYAVQFHLDEHVDCVAGTHAGLSGGLAFSLRGNPARKSEKSPPRLYPADQ